MRAPEFCAPRDLAALATALGRATPASRLIAGGTDVMLQLRASGERPDLLIDISGMGELVFVREQGGRIHIGALTSFARIEADGLLRIHANCLSQAAAHVGSAQVRNIATIGGNVANASACADAIPALLALDADLGIVDRTGQVRRYPLREVLARAGGPRPGVGEAIVDFSFASLRDHQRSAFAKVGVRSSVAVARLNAALFVTLDAARASIAGARIAFGSVAPVAFLDERVAAGLCGRALDEDTAQRFADACAALVTEAIAQRASRPYKQWAIRGLADDLWNAIRGSPTH